MNVWWMPDEFQVTAWWMPDECLMNAWWMPDDYLMTAWWLPDDCLMTAWWPLDDCLMTAWWSDFFLLLFLGKGNVSNASHCLCHSNFLSATKIQFLAMWAALKKLPQKIQLWIMSNIFLQLGLDFTHGTLTFKFHTSFWRILADGF